MLQARSSHMKIEHEALDSAQVKMDKALANLRKELASLRAGRANAQLLDSIFVDYYGSRTPINQMANISTPEPRLLVISPWDASTIKSIEKAIHQSDLGINPSNDGKVIRLAFPEVTGEKRKELVKIAKKRAEEAKVAVRGIRRDTNEIFKKEKKISELTEDDYDIVVKEIQELTDEMIKKIDSITAAKEQEITEI